jgi:diphthamide synthase (EF-2-diphthine--ammonia ligase)
MCPDAGSITGHGEPTLRDRPWAGSTLTRVGGEPVVLSWSGGKDCTAALARLRADPSVTVSGLLTTVTDAFDRVSMHGLRRSLLRTQARMLGLEVKEVVIPPDATNAAYDEAMGVTLAALAREGVRTVAFGDIHLADVRAYREERLATLDMRASFPLWGEDTTVLAARFIAEGHRATVVCVDTEMLPTTFCGRDYDSAFIGDLPPGVDPCGEEGSFHTFVHAGPHLVREIPVRRGQQVTRDGRFLFQDLLPGGPP